MHPPLTHTKSPAGLGVHPEMMAAPMVVRRGLANFIGSKNLGTASGWMNNIQFWMSYHLRMQMGRLMSMMAKKARANQKQAYS